MIATNLLPQCIPGKTRKALALLVFSCFFWSLSFSQSGITANGSGGYDLVGTVTQPAVLTFDNTPNTINFIIQKGTAPYLYVGNDGKVGIGVLAPGDNTLYPSTYSKLFVNGSISLYGSATQKIFGGYTVATTSINMYNAAGGLDFTPAGAGGSNPSASSFLGPLTSRGYFTVQSLSTSSSPANIVSLNVSDLTVRGGTAAGYNYVKLYGQPVADMEFGSHSNYMWSKLVTVPGVGTTATESMRLTAAGNLLIGTPTQVSSAALNVHSTSKGVLFPRMNTSERDAIVSPVKGLLIYNNQTNRFEYCFDNTAVPISLGWKPLDGNGACCTLQGVTDAGATTTHPIIVNGSLRLGLGNNSIASNIAIGAAALDVNTTGTDNLAIGLGSLGGNSTGKDNTAVGYTAIGRNKMGERNVAVGSLALFENGEEFTLGPTPAPTNVLSGEATENTAVGALALNGNIKGNGNTGVGYWALKTNVNSNYNTALGYEADITAATGIEKATAIGYNAKVGQSNSIVLGDANAKVGIHTPSPQTELDVIGKTKTDNFQMTSGAFNNYVLTSSDGNGNAEWKDPRLVFEDECEIKWTACRLGLVPGPGTTNEILNASILSGLNSSHPEIHSIWFESDFGSADFYIGTQSGTIDLGGRVLKFERGNKLMGSATLTNFSIDASQESDIFDINLNISPIATTNGWFSAKWFGAKGVNTIPHNPITAADEVDYKAIQKSINTCISSGLLQLKIPRGNYMITQPLIIRKQTGHVTLIVEGEGGLWANGTTSIYTTFNDAFAIGIQLGKGCKIKNLAITGRFAPPRADIEYTDRITHEDGIVEGGNIEVNHRRTFMETKFDDFEDITTIAVPSSIPPYTYAATKARDKRFSPYAGIVVDPFTNKSSAGTMAGLGLGWEGYPGLEDYYGYLAGVNTALNDLSGSSGIEIDNVTINNFVVGIASAVNGKSLNQEFMKITRVRIDNCKLSVSAAHAQEKANVIDGLACWGGTHTVFATGKYGLINHSAVLQAGYWHLSNFNLAGAVVQLIDNYQGNWFPVQIDNVYAESLGRFGTISALSSSGINNGTEISNSVFVFENPTNVGLIRLMDLHGEFGNGVVFKNCMFRYAGFHPYYRPSEEEAGYSDYQKGFHKDWKKNLMMIFRCKEALFEDCSFSGVPIQEIDMSTGSFLSTTRYKNCTAAKYVFGQDISREEKQITQDHDDATDDELGRVEDRLDHRLFYNNYKVKSKGTEKTHGIGETYQFEGSEVFVNFFNMVGENAESHGIKLTEGSYAFNSTTSFNDNTKYYTEFIAENPDYFYVGGIVVFSTYLSHSDCNAAGYGIITGIDHDTKKISVGYVSEGVKSGTNYTVSCLYPAVQCGSFMGNIKDGNTIERVAADWGGVPEEYVGNLIKCPYTNALGGWTKIVSYDNDTYDHETHMPIPYPTTDYSDHNAGTFKVLGNGNSQLSVSPGTYYFNNGATKTLETTKWNQRLKAPFICCSSPARNKALMCYRGQKLIEYEKSDIAVEHTCIRTGYQDISLDYVKTPGYPYLSQPESRQACFITLDPLPTCETALPRPKGGTSAAWNLNGNTIIATNAKDSTDEEADADTTQFLGTKNNVGLRIKTGNKERLAIDKNGVVTVGEVDLKTITNHKDPKQNYQFAVKGNAIFERAVVKLSTNWPDFVFDEKYKLMSLEELEKYIQENKHLPGLPPAEKAEKEGVDVGNHQAALLNKLEEMTLYILQQNKKAEEQNKQIEELKAQNSQLLDVQKQIDELKKAINKQPAKPAE